MTLDPYARAKDLGLSIFFRPLEAWSALWFHEQRVIVMRQNMSVDDEVRALTACMDRIDAGDLEIAPPPPLSSYALAA